MTNLHGEPSTDKCRCGKFTLGSDKWKVTNGAVHKSYAPCQGLDDAPTSNPKEEKEYEGVANISADLLGKLRAFDIPNNRAVILCQSIECQIIKVIQRYITRSTAVQNTTTEPNGRTISHDESEKTNKADLVREVLQYVPKHWDLCENSDGEKCDCRPYKDCRDLFVRALMQYPKYPTQKAPEKEALSERSLEDKIVPQDTVIESKDDTRRSDELVAPQDTDKGCCSKCREFDDFQKSIDEGHGETYCNNPKCRCHHPTSTRFTADSKEPRDEKGAKKAHYAEDFTHSTDKNTWEKEFADVYDSGGYDEAKSFISELLTKERAKGIPPYLYDKHKKEMYELGKKHGATEAINQIKKMIERKMRDGGLCAKDLNGPLCERCKEIRKWNAALTDLLKDLDTI